MLVLSIALLVGLAVTTIGGAVILLLRNRQEAEVARVRARRDHVVPTAQPRGTLLVRTAIRLGDLTSAGASQALRGRLARAGFYSSVAPPIYLGSKLLLLAGGMLGSSIVLTLVSLSLTLKASLFITATAVLFFLPNFVVGMQRSKRAKEIKRRVPDAIDLLEICVSSGMGLDAAWNAVAVEIRRISPVLADEMELTKLEISLGVERSVAMRNLSKRSGSDDMSSLVSLLVQSERFGSSISEALRSFAQSIRQTQSAAAEEAAAKTAVKLLFPMVMFIFPALLIVTVGPALMTLMDVMGGD